MNEATNRRMDGWMDGQTNERTNERPIERTNSNSSLADATLCEACTAFGPGHLHLGPLVERLLRHRQGGIPKHKALGPVGRAIL